MITYSISIRLVAKQRQRTNYEGGASPRGSRGPEPVYHLCNRVDIRVWVTYLPVLRLHLRLVPGRGHDPCRDFHHRHYANHHPCDCRDNLK